MLRIEFERLLRPSFLDEAKQPVQYDDAENDRCVDPQAEHQLGEACTKQDVDQDIIELRQEADKRPLFLPSGNRLGPYFCMRLTASPRSRPDSVLVASCFTTSSAVMACQADTEPADLAVTNVSMGVPRLARLGLASRAESSTA